MSPEVAPLRNIELKARDDDLAGSLRVCRALDAEDHGEISQRDTYFNVASGGLKLEPVDDRAVQSVNAAVGIEKSPTVAQTNAERTPPITR